MGFLVRSMLIDAILAVVGPAKQLTETMLDLAKAASPAQGKQFDLAVADSVAVLGRVFVPVLELATDAVRTFGDFLASILPNSGDIRAALAPLNDVMKEMREVAADLAPIIKHDLLVALGLFAEGLKNLVSQLKAVWGQVRNLFGIQKNEAGLASSQGASASTASFSGIEEYSRQNQLRAASAGSENIMSTTEGELVQIKMEVKAIVAILKEYGAKANASVPGQIANRYVQGVKNIEGYIEGAWDDAKTIYNGPG